MSPRYWNGSTESLLQAPDLKVLHKQNDIFVSLKLPGSAFTGKTFLVFQKTSVHSSGANLQVLSERKQILFESTNMKSKHDVVSVVRSDMYLCGVKSDFCCFELLQRRVWEFDEDAAD